MRRRSRRRRAAPATSYCSRWKPWTIAATDPDPQTLLTSLAPEQNIDRLHRLMSQLQGYVGLVNAMGARFTASEGSLAPILSETAKRGLVYVDDGSNPATIAGRLAAADNLPFSRADVIIDSVPTPEEIDRALGRLEEAAREHASRSASPRRARPRSTASRNGRRRPRTVVSSWCQSAAP